MKEKQGEKTSSRVHEGKSRAGKPAAECMKEKQGEKTSNGLHDVGTGGFMEVWDGYRADGTLAGVDLIRGEEIPEGLYHIVCDILVRHKDGDYLLMRRDLHKDIHPGEWESTAGGSALKGEDAVACARRELLEETGIHAAELTEVYFEVYYSKNVLFHCYVCEVDCDKTSVTLQEGETIDYKWLTEAEFIDFVNSGEMMQGLKRRYSGWLQDMGYLR